MSAEVRHAFASHAEAQAFVEGVEWVNDGAIEFRDYVQVDGTTYAVFEDDDATEPEVHDHRPVGREG